MADPQAPLVAGLRAAPDGVFANQIFSNLVIGRELGWLWREGFRWIGSPCGGGGGQRLSVRPFWVKDSGGSTGLRVGTPGLVTVHPVRV